MAWLEATMSFVFSVYQVSCFYHKKNVPLHSCYNLTVCDKSVWFEKWKFNVDFSSAHESVNTARR